MAMEKVPMTIEGFKKLEEELQRLKSEERPAHHPADLRCARARRPVRERRVPCRQRGARSQRGARGRHRGQASRAEVIDITKLSGDTVKFGATVTLEDEDTGEKVKYKIVGDTEANVRDGKISISSPIARALIGKSKDDTGRGDDAEGRALLPDPEDRVEIGPRLSAGALLADPAGRHTGWGRRARAWRGGW